MKNKIAYFFAIFLMSIQFGFSQQANVDVLLSAQKKMDSTLLVCIQKQNLNDLKLIRSKVEAIKQSPIQNYWLAYEYYCEANYYLKSGKNDLSDEAIEKGISILKDGPGLGAETFSLLAMLQTFSIQLSGGMSAAMISESAVENANIAYSMDSLNPRASYVLALNDYYTPVEYGGQEKTEYYLKRLISNYEKTKAIDNPYLPHWGVEDSYVLLIQYYLAQNSLEKAREYYKRGLLKFPNSPNIIFYEKAVNPNL